MFHISQLKKCLRVPEEAVEIEGLPLQPDLTFVEHPIKILDEKESDQEQCDKILQGAMAKSFRRRSHLGARELHIKALPPPSLWFR